MHSQVFVRINWVKNWLRTHPLLYTVTLRAEMATIWCLWFHDRKNLNYMPCITIMCINHVLCINEIPYDVLHFWWYSKTKMECVNYIKTHLQVSNHHGYDVGKSISYYTILLDVIKHECHLYTAITVVFLTIHLLPRLLHGIFIPYLEDASSAQLICFHMITHSHNILMYSM